MQYIKASRGAEAQNVTVKSTGCGFDPHSRKRNIYLYFHFFALVSRRSAVLSLATQYAMPPEFGGKWGSENLNTRFPLPTLLCARCSVKLIHSKFQIIHTDCQMFRKLGGAWVKEWLITKFPLSTSGSVYLHDGIYYLKYTDQVLV